MIFVTVGFSYWNFERLLREMDTIAGRISEDVVIQIGNSNYTPKNAKYFRFVSNEEVEKSYNDARIIIAHAGVGTIIEAARLGKPLIIVPRRAQYEEHFDDHQAELGRELEKEKWIKVIWEIHELENSIYETINESSRGFFAPIKNERLIESLRSYISSLKGST